MNFPRWRQSLTRSLYLHRSKPEAKYFQIASIGVGNAVNNRTMVFRGFVEESSDLLAITDSRSDKIKDWHTHPHSQICWYFPKSKEQYRISVDVSFYANNDMPLRALVWDQLSYNAKKQFFWPHPKAPFDENSKNLFTVDGSEREDAQSISQSNEIPANFIVLKFTPNYVDYLNLSHSPQTREIYKPVNGKWEHSRVNP